MYNVSDSVIPICVKHGGNVGDVNKKNLRLIYFIKAIVFRYFYYILVFNFTLCKYPTSIYVNIHLYY